MFRKVNRGKRRCHGFPVSFCFVANLFPRVFSIEPAKYSTRRKTPRVPRAAPTLPIAGLTAVKRLRQFFRFNS